MYDIAIIGLGPAGATFARLVDKKYKTVVIDKKSNKEDCFHKPCGGLLATDAQKSLSSFNLTLPTNVLVNPQIFAVKTIDTKQDLKQYYQRFYMNLDRHKFDMWLISLIGSHVNIIDDANCSSIKKENDHYVIEYKKDDVVHVIQAKHIVGADGANSIVRHTIYPNHKIRTYISIQEWFEDKNAKPLYSCIFDKEITDCYSWSISKDGYFIVGGAFPIDCGKERFALLKEKMINNGYILNNPLKKEACLVLRPKSLSDFCCGKDNAFLIGEAAGFISPSSLEGMSYAFDSGYELAKVFNTSTNNYNRMYTKNTRKIRVKLFTKNFKSIFMYVPWLRKIVMKSKLQTIQVLDDN